jgi:parallel beta-helix repeat protein
VKTTLRANASVAAVALAVGSGLWLSPADAAPAPVVLECGATITEDTVLAADMGPCPEDAVIIDADDVLFDLNGHEIVGQGGQVVPHQSAGVFITNQTGVQVRNGTVRGFFHGIRVQQGSGNTVNFMNVTNNEGGNGIVLENSSDNRVANNTVTDNGRFSGISTFNSRFFPAGSARNTIVDNVVTGNDFTATTPGIGLENGAGHFVRGNTVTGNAGAGISVRLQTTGVSVTDSIIARNVVSGNGGHGIVLPVGANRNTIRDNRVTDNGADGVHIESQSNRIQRNTATGNAATDLVDTNADCDNNLWNANTFTTANPACAGS